MLPDLRGLFKLEIKYNIHLNRKFVTDAGKILAYYYIRS